MVRFFVEIKFYSFAIFLSNQLWILIFLNEMSTRPSKTWTEITYNDFLSILESLEWQAFTNKAILYFTPCCLKYIFSNLSKFHLYGYVVDFLYIALRNESTIFNTTQINLIIDFLKFIQNFNQEISVETQKKITSTIQLYL